MLQWNSVPSETKLHFYFDKSLQKPVTRCRWSSKLWWLSSRLADCNGPEECNNISCVCLDGFHFHMVFIWGGGLYNYSGISSRGDKVGWWVLRRVSVLTRHLKTTSPLTGSSIPLYRQNTHNEKIIKATQKSSQSDNCDANLIRETKKLI